MQQPTSRTVGYVSVPYVFTAGTLTIASPPAPATLAEMARQGTHYQVAPLRHGLTGGISDPQHQALAIAAQFGRIYRGGRDGEAPVRVLTALARRGLLTLTAHPGPRRANWARGEITHAGRNELARLEAQHADRARIETALKPRASVTTQVDPFALVDRDHTAETIAATVAA